uniref:Uncharacterized protein n=1 Tax=Coturnix japonica TaxID=93934 RepID=A0A8C2Y877_COTJA
CNIDKASWKISFCLPSLWRPAEVLLSLASSVNKLQILRNKPPTDLALVSGVGAAKLEQVKFEICVSSKGSSAQHSPSSLRKDLASEHHLSATKININTATPAQLMSIRGITEKIANSIVDYRKEHGPFKSIEDLVRMNCINSSFLDKIRHQIFSALPCGYSSLGGGLKDFRTCRMAWAV